MADDPAAAELARDFGRLRAACLATPPQAFRDLRGSVLDEIADREAAAESRVEVAGRLEPEGDFGLPFGRSSRSWAWAGLAVAAALLIGFYGRPDPPAARQTVARQSASPQITDVVNRVRQALPQTRKVRITTTPEGLRRLEQLLASRGYQLGQPAAAAAPPELVALRKFGVETAKAKADNQLLLVSAERPAVSGLLQDLEKEEGMFRVEADRPIEPSAAEKSAQQSAAAPSGAGPGYVLRLSPRQSSAPTIGVKQTPSVAIPSGRTPVLFVIQLKSRP